VVSLIAWGLSNRQIAGELLIAERTVHAHVGNILGKLNFPSRAQVAAWAVERGLLAAHPGLSNSAGARVRGSAHGGCRPTAVPDEDW
jgi:hypothetical protein